MNTLTFLSVAANHHTVSNRTRGNAARVRNAEIDVRVETRPRSTPVRFGVLGVNNICQLKIVISAMPHANF
ncbi:MAG: hypothetical protein H7Y02_00645 [Candidatus Obscuribacterales bacterium]|nr:hypothetical protein [Steroidobacteraceae bacterium]